MQRRDFLASTLLGAPAFLYGARTRKFNVALVGTGHQGMWRLTEAMRTRECKIVALCDLDPNQIACAAKSAAAMSGDRPATFRDFREMLGKAGPDITIVATPDHWHALIALEAVRSGSHVFIEPPMSHTVSEGRELVRAARESDRVVQAGASSNLSRSGRQGKIDLVRAYVHTPASPGIAAPDSDAPTNMDWAMWCGPAPYRPFNRGIHPGGFRHYLDYSNGPMSELLRHALGWTDERHPRRIHSTGGRHMRRDAGDAPDTQTACFEFESFTLEFEHRTYLGNPSEPVNAGVWFHGTKGTVHAGVHPSSRQFSGFLDNIHARRRNVEDLAACHRATSLGLLANVSLKLGRGIDWDGREATRLLNRPVLMPSFMT